MCIPLARFGRNWRDVCNLYSITTNEEAIRALFRVMNRYVGNLAPMPGVFPDYPAPTRRIRWRRSCSDEQTKTVQSGACG